MTVSADTVRIALVGETTPGVTPATPGFRTVRTTGEGIGFDYQSTVSGELAGETRGVRDSILTGGEVTGPINFELSKDATFEDMVAAVFGQDWGDDPLSIGATVDDLYVGNEKKTFTVEKTWDMGAGAPDPFLYHRYKGCIPDTLTLDLRPNQPITGSLNFIGQSLETAATAIAGATYTAASTTPVMTAPNVTGITLYDGATVIVGLATSTFLRLGVSLNSNVRSISGIGTLGAKDAVLGRFEGTIDFQIYFASNALLDGLKNQTDYRLVVTMNDALGNAYELEFPRVRIATAKVVAGGTGQDVEVAGQINVLLGLTPNLYAAKITRTAA